MLNTHDNMETLDDVVTIQIDAYVTTSGTELSNQVQSCALWPLGQLHEIMSICADGCLQLSSFGIPHASRLNGIPSCSHSDSGTTL